MATWPTNPDCYGCKRMSNETVLEKMKSKIILDLHEKWALENGYRDNETLNSKNSVGFKDGAER